MACPLCYRGGMIPKWTKDDLRYGVQLAAIFIAIGALMGLFNPIGVISGRILPRRGDTIPLPLEMPPSSEDDEAAN